MVKTWMPLYVGDYVGDTLHLELDEHGAYFLLMMTYWRNGGAIKPEVYEGICKEDRIAENLKEFFYMGGYAFYVWASYGIALIVLVANVLSPIFQRRRLLADLARRQRRARREQ